MTGVHYTHRDPAQIEVLATLAHELRNPLAAIQCAVRALEAPNLTGATFEQARVLIDTQLMRIVRITDDLMSVARVATGKMVVRKEIIELASIVEAAVDSCRPAIDASRHTLLVQLPARAVSLEADPVRLAQVLVNLLDNSAKYSVRNGKIRLSVESSAGEAIIRVSDDGIGIAPEILPNVFDLFVQADASREHSRGGLGIGLSLVKRIVELHGGTVEACSEGPGCGSTFTVRIPVIDAAVPMTCPAMV
ncbi:HAMP domain-containing sensor histidine kinase [Povalibacter sp.]|uniref:sensor histidine kinase n=1 Tax=Povalibacter sp. TaxID=1962978 RepID=UPI002F3EB5CD